MPRRPAHRHRVGLRGRRTGGQRHWRRRVTPAAAARRPRRLASQQHFLERRCGCFAEKISARSAASALGLPRTWATKPRPRREGWVWGRKDGRLGAELRSRHQGARSDSPRAGRSITAAPPFSVCLMIVPPTRLVLNVWTDRGARAGLSNFVRCEISQNKKTLPSAVRGPRRQEV